MKKHTRSSITLPPADLKLVSALQAKLRARTKVEVVRRGLRLLREATDREALREGYRKASLATRDALAQPGTPAGDRRVGEFLASQPFPHYEAAARRPGYLLRIEADGRRTVGRFVQRRFVPAKSSRRRAPA